MAGHEGLPTSSEKEVVGNTGFNKSGFDSRLGETLETRSHGGSLYLKSLISALSVGKLDDINWEKLQQYLTLIRPNLLKKIRGLEKKIETTPIKELERLKNLLEGLADELEKKFPIISLASLGEFVKKFPDLEASMDSGDFVDANELYEMYLLFKYYLNLSYNEQTKEFEDPLGLTERDQIKGVKNLEDFKKYLGDYIDIELWDWERNEIVVLLNEIDEILKEYDKEYNSNKED